MMYVNEIIVLYTLNSAVYLLYLSKTGRNKIKYNSEWKKKKDIVNTAIIKKEIYLV